MQYYFAGQFHFLKRVLLTALTLSLTACQPVEAAAEAPVGLAADSEVSLSGIGPIRIGMTIAEAAAAGQIALVGYGGKVPVSSDCAYIKAEEGWPELAFMIGGNRIVRVDVRNPRTGGDAPSQAERGKSSLIATSAGIKLGDAERKVKLAYPEIAVTNHKYIAGGHYLSVTAEPGGPLSENRLIFETDHRRVTAIRSGRLPEVEWVEGCG